jgi:5-formyltetrahydrofolate cyclo-ligase
MLKQAWHLIALNKALLRKLLREKRQQLSDERKRLASQQVATLLSASVLFQKSVHIACYMAAKAELNTLPIIQMIWQAGKKCYLPVISHSTQSLHFFLYEQNDALMQNQYGILEPSPSQSISIPNNQLDLVLVPMMGFDLQCHRLGTGGGYYDRSFAFRLLQPKPRMPRLIGLGYACQAIDTLPTESWDVPMDGVFTEKEFILA